MTIFKFLCCVFLAGVFVVVPHNLWAQSVPPTCDAEYWDVLKDRSWLEGKRQFEFAQKLVLKQDSTLQYVCFRQRLIELNSPGAHWSNRKGNMARALGVLIVPALNNYLGRNFNHTMGGGTSGIIGGPCSTMAQIWQFLKCKNFDKADFRTLNQLVPSDPRTTYRPCIKPERTTKWQDAIDTAFPPPTTPATNGGMDRLNTYITALQESCNRAEPMPTGVMVSLTGEAPYEEHVCLPSGCSWRPGDQYCH